MEKQKNLIYFAGLDIGTNSTGYAACTTDYQLLKFQQHPIWGVHLFDSALPASKRRTFRTARRRIARRRQRIQLLRELFAPGIAAVDPHFFQRIENSSRKKDPDEVRYAVFADENYTDRDFYNQYPTIHHLIAELIDSDAPHDIRLVYAACAWLIVHRGHFFSDVNREKINELFSFSNVYSGMETLLDGWSMAFPWKSREDVSSEGIGNILTAPIGRQEKVKRLAAYLQIDKKADYPEFPFDAHEFLKILCGSEGKMGTLFRGKDYDSKLSLDSDDEKIAETLSQLDDEDSALILEMKKVFDWSVLANIMGGNRNLSLAKVQIYERHREDLKNLKYLFRKYLSAEDYKEVFRAGKDDTYNAYVGKKTKRADAQEKSAGSEKKSDSARDKFFKLLKKKLSAIAPDEKDAALVARIDTAIQEGKFLPRQVTTDNRTIPYQIYWNELRDILRKASGYLPFLTEKNADGLTAQEKILSIMEFRIPYFVGPLNPHSPFAWLKRKAEGRILPWNFEEKVDLDASEEAFIKRMTSNCTYLPGEPALPKHSLLYQKFEVLNLINNIRIDDCPISAECKQQIYELFKKKKESE